MRRQLAVLMLACGTGVVGTPSPATAQVSVGVQLYWEWNDGAWRPHRYEWNARHSAYYMGGRAAWVPRAYMPPAGYCREWIPGVPVWRQPPPVPCDRLFNTYRYARAGVVILGSLGYAGPMVRYGRNGWMRPVVPYERDRWERRDRWEGRERRVIYQARPPRTVYKENPRRVVHEDRSPRGERVRVAVPRTPRADQGHGRDGAQGRDRGNAARGNRGNGNHGNNGNGNHGGRGRGGG